MYNLNESAVIFFILLMSIFIPLIFLLVKLWIEQYKIQFDNDE